MTRRMKRSLALSVASAVVASSLVPFGGAAFAATGDPAAAGPVLPPTVSADALPTVQINGVVWAQLVVGNTVYVTGDFTSARPAGAAAGTNETARRNILAYDIRTGNLITSWAPTLNSTGLALAASADGRTIYVGGNFTSSSGVASSRIVALDATTGAVVRSFSAAGANDKVRALAVVGDTVYAGGTFTAAGPAGQQTARSRLAAFKASDGSLTDWAPQADAEVLAMVAPSSTPEIVIGGRFAAVNGAQALGTAAVDLTSGASLPWEINKTVYEYGAKSAIWSLSTDGTSVYGTGYDTDRIGNLENAFAADANGGGIRWVNGCLGDSYSSFPMNGVLYTVGHTHECESLPDGIVDKAPRAYQNAIAMTTANFGNVNKTNAYGWSGGLPGPSLLHWLPTLTSGTYTTSKQAAWSLAGNSQYLVMGGEFPTVNGTAQQGLTRFAVRSQAPMKQGPQQASTMAVDVANTGPGQVSASFLAAWDRDDESLTYELLRGPAASPTVVATTTAKSAFWDRKRLTLVDPSPVVGTLTSYRVRTTDGSGNVQVSPPQAITASATLPSTAYDDAVRADAPDHYWSLGEASGAAGFDTSGSAVTQSLSVDPSATRGAEGQVAGTTATTFTGTVEVPIPGAGIGAKTEVIAHATTTQPVVAPQTYSTEAWFKTTSTSGGEIISFGNRREDFRSSAYDRSTYLTDDGSIIGGVYDGRVRTIQSKPGYNDGQWHHVVQTKGAGGLAMYVDGVLVGRDAGVSGIQDYEGYWRLGGDNLGGWPGQVSSSALAGSVDDVAVYGTALTSAQVANHYRASGRTPAGAKPNAAPTASFTSQVTDLGVALDGSGSADSDGTVASYAWDFGDQSTGTGRATSHTYTAAGTYTVKLVVTDDKGATGTVSRSVTVTAPVVAPTGLLTDTFTRTASGGWGTADAGGAWTPTSGAANFSVDGSTGLLVIPGASSTRSIYASSLSSTNVDLVSTLALDKLPTGTGTTVSLLGRRISATTDYRVQARISSTGQVVLGLGQVVNGTYTSLGQQTVSGLKYTAGAPLRMRIQVVGTGTTALRAKVWAAGTAEPTAWNLSATDSAAALQAPGSVGVMGFLSASSTNAPVTLRVDDLSATTPR